MGTSVITHTQTDMVGTPVPSYVTNFRLTTAAGTDSGFRLSDGTGIASAYAVTASTAGSISVSLENNSNIVPAGSFYVAELLLPSSAGGTDEWALLSSSSVSPQNLYDALVNPIPSYVPFSTVPASVLAANNVFTGTNSFTGDVAFGSGHPWYDVAAFGAVGNGVTDDTVAIAAAYAAAAVSGGTVAFSPYHTYLVSNTLTPGSNTYTLGNGATLLAKDQSWIKAVVSLNGVTNNLVVNLTVDGNKGSAGGVNNRVLGLEIKGGSGHTIRDSTFKNCPGASAAGTNQGDGLYISRDSGGNIPTDITLDNVTCDANVRQGMSVISVKRLKAVNCRFKNTTGTDPGAGVDFEPDTSSDTIEDVELVDCDYTGNFKGITSSASAGASMTNLKIQGGTCALNTSTARGIFIDTFISPSVLGVTVRDNAGNGIEFSGGAWATAQGCTVTGNGGNGIKTSSRGSRVTANTVFLNGLHGIYLVFRSPIPSGHICTDNLSFNNSVTTNNTYSGIFHDGNASVPSQRSIFSGNQCPNSTGFNATAQQAYGIRTETDVQQCVFIGNVATGNLSADFNIVAIESQAIILNANGAAADLHLGSGSLTFAERTAPSAPAANRVVIYAVDNAAKTRFASLFNTGAVQPLSTEP